MSEVPLYCYCRVLGGMVHLDSRKEGSGARREDPYPVLIALIT
jgi:hypothetical protein